MVVQERGVTVEAKARGDSIHHLRRILEPDFDGPVEGARDESLVVVDVPGDASNWRGVSRVAVQ